MPTHYQWNQFCTNVRDGIGIGIQNNHQTPQNRGGHGAGNATLEYTNHEPKSSQSPRRRAGGDKKLQRGSRAENLLRNDHRPIMMIVVVAIGCNSMNEIQVIKSFRRFFSVANRKLDRCKILANFFIRLSFRSVALTTSDYSQ